MTPELLEIARLLIEEQNASKAARTAEEEDHETVSRELEIVTNKAFGTYMIKRKGGGKVPVILQGHWLDFELAKRNLEAWQRKELRPQGKWADKIAEEKERLMREKAEADKLAANIKEEKNTLAKMKKELEEIQKLKAEVQAMKDKLKKSA